LASAMQGVGPGLHFFGLLMRTLIFLAWQLSRAIENIALLAMLGGVFQATWTIVRLPNDEGRSGSGTVPQAAWKSDGTKIGITLVVFGLGLDMLSIAVRLLLPAS
jgi:hypothetical protein